MSVFNEIARYWRFTRSVGKFLNEPVALEQSRAIIRKRLQNRDKNLLAVVKGVIYNNEKSPYLKLLRMVGCEYGDFERLVYSDGVEPALRELCRKGVYISYEEFKGKKDVIRGSQSFVFKESDFDNPFLSNHLEGSTGGSRSAGTKLTIDLNSLAHFADYDNVNLESCDALDLPGAVWYPILPGVGPISILKFAKINKTPVKWFSQVSVSNYKPPFKYKMATNFIGYVARLYGKKLPQPEFIPLDKGLLIANWLAATIKEKGGCLLSTYVSSAVRVCQAARERGLSLIGATFIVSGEPLTNAKRKEIESVGVRVYPLYATMEFGAIGIGCVRSTRVDDFHVASDGCALIQHRREVPHSAVSVDAFLFTSLLPVTSKVALNVESGDYGSFETRSCECKLEELGLTEHIHSIRGFDKLTAEGMTFVGTEFVRIIEEVLPAEFGGVSTDYQIVEEEDEKGFTRLIVFVNPEVGEINEADLLQTIITELSKPSGRWMAPEIWSQAKTLRVKRMRPFATMGSKILPLHIRKYN